MSSSIARVAGVFALAAGLHLAAGPAAAQGAAEATTYRNQRYGFSLSYPNRQFRARGPFMEEGRLWISRDGNARLLAVALPNADGMSLEDYRALVLERRYPGAELDYAPLRKSWFVVSGTRDDTMFYERVTFTCGGRLINRWAMLYPVAERSRYDRIVEQVAKSYRAGARDCD